MYFQAKNTLKNNRYYNLKKNAFETQKQTRQTLL
jgi:hypothetical protein